MKTIKKKVAKVLEVTVVQNQCRDEEVYENFFSYEILEFENGLIVVEGESTHDWFFESKEDFEPCGTDSVVSIVDTGKTVSWGSDEILKSVQGSISEFGEEAVPKNHLALWK